MKQGDVRQESWVRAFLVLTLGGVTSVCSGDVSSIETDELGGPGGGADPSPGETSIEAEKKPRLNEDPGREESPDLGGQRMVIYQLPVRLFGNTNPNPVRNGTLEENGVGLFADVNDAALTSLRELGVTWIYLTGVFRQATLTDWSSIGLPADDPDVVKGRAGSFFAVRDYYDVCPDYAVDPRERLREFDELVDRIHRQGMRVMVDLAPNHVARGYQTVVDGKQSFGEGDNQDVWFDPQNHFYYLQDGNCLQLPVDDWDAAGDVRRDGRFVREDGSPGRRVRATGDNGTSAWPSAQSWYETVKLNYGAPSFPEQWWEPPALAPGVSWDNPPRTWTLMADIISYWLTERQVDGFRCDLVNMMPPEALRYLISQARTVRPDAFFMAEVYADYQRYFDAGFDAVYHKDPWDRLKSISFASSVSATLDAQGEIEAELARYTSAQHLRMMHFLENHDEARVMAPRRSYPVESGWGGGLRAHYQMAPVLLLLTGGPVLVFAGQEVGEKAEGAEGFGRDEGKTSMFDYGSIKALVGWVNDHRYDGGGLDDEQRDLRRFYGELLHVLKDPIFAGDVHAGLDGFNVSQNRAAYPDSLFSYARCATGEGQLALVVTNFEPNPNVSTSGTVRLPRELTERCGLNAGATLDVAVALEGTPADSQPTSRPPETIEVARLVEQGLPVEISGRATRVFILR